MTPRGGERWARRAMERIIRHPFLGAWRAIAAVSLVATVTAGLLMRVTDPAQFPSLGAGLWWAVQTVTTVGYGDLVPTSPPGRLLGAVVMLGGIAFITVTTAAITSAFVESARRRAAAATPGGDPHAAELARVRSELAALTAEVRALRAERDAADPPSPPGR